MSNLGFGKHFSPWMTSMNWSTISGWSALKVSPLEPIPLHPAAGVLQYSQSIFEGMKAFRHPDGAVRIFRPDFHRLRFERSAERVCLPRLPEGAFEEAVLQAVRANLDSVPAGEGEALYLRPTLIATEGFLGVRPAGECLFYIVCSPVGSYFSKGTQGLKILVETHYSRAARGGIGAAKAGANYVASLLVAELAKQQGFDQVLWTDTATHTMVEEVGTMNVFFVIGPDKKVITPPLSDTLLNGGTRDAALTMLRRQGLEVMERPVTLLELKELHQAGELLECFGTGTAAVVSPIRELQDSDATLNIQLPENFAVAERLRKDITDVQYGRSQDPFQWMVAT